ncbi:sigma-E factor negative regulatory protein [Colwellia psychrerythraea]|uniref:Anti-sigma-E factor RseA n=1 Tax=Colwellia psychrerythraea TaxID=28229 RepID=A0A099KFM3_COLPS|nr:RseA family anti-sigma factor [Colwellia psychrerythraea]KGJ89075.1 anti sigma-E protein, RseA [Colwellia psychrerythraea]
MSEIKSESISSLVDNYSPSTDTSVNTHLVDNMLKDEHLSSTWQNYHLIGDVLRDEVPQSLQLDLSKTISAAIAQEATILSPNSSTQSSSNSFAPLTNDAVVQTSESVKSTSRVIDATNRFKAKISALVKPMGQVAIAASAAALMIVGVQNNISDNSSITPSQVVQTVPLTGYANPVSFSVQSTKFQKNQQGKLQAQQVMNEQLAAERVAQQRRLQALLKDHTQQVKLGSNIK